MMIGCKETRARIQESSKQPRKENIPMSSPTNSKTVTFSTVYPNQTYSRILQSQYMNASQPQRVSSPVLMVNSVNVKPRVIELGGSKEKRISR